MDPFEISKSVFLEIKNEFPKVSMDLSERLEHHSVVLEMCIPIQVGIKYAITLTLLNHDELTFGVSNFFCEWFPCTDPKVATNYKDAVIGFIRGEYRIVEHFKKKWPYKALLQKSTEGNWVTVCFWAQPSWPISFNKSKIIVSNL